MLPKEILKQVRRIEIKTGKLVNDIFAGQYESVFKGRGMEFSEVREYQPGDDVRTIDWNVTARFGHPFVKRFTEERELTCMLVVDASSSQEFGSTDKLKSELSAEISAFMARSISRPSAMSYPSALSRDHPASVNSHHRPAAKSALAFISWAFTPAT